VVFVLVIGLVACDFLVRLREDLQVTATRTSLGVGESVRVTVQKKLPWFRALPLMGDLGRARGFPRGMVNSTAT